MIPRFKNDGWNFGGQEGSLATVGMKISMIYISSIYVMMVSLYFQAKI